MGNRKKITIVFEDENLKGKYICEVSSGEEKLVARETEKNLVIDIQNKSKSNRYEILFTSVFLSAKQSFWLVLPLWVLNFIGNSLSFKENGWPYKFLLELELDQDFEVEVMASLNLTTFFNVKGYGYRVIQKGLVDVRGYKMKWFILYALPIFLVFCIIAFVMYFALVTNLSFVVQLIFVLVVLTLLLSYSGYLYKIMTQKVLNR